jgi:hypothetical protein
MILTYPQYAAHFEDLSGDVVIRFDHTYDESQGSRTYDESQGSQSGELHDSVIMSHNGLQYRKL